MEWPGLRRQILENTLSWLITNFGSFVLIFPFSPRLSVGNASCVAVLNLTMACLFVPQRILRPFKKWQQKLLLSCVSVIFFLPVVLFAWFNFSLLEMPLFQDGWLLFCGLLACVYLMMIAVLALSYCWLPRRLAN